MINVSRKHTQVDTVAQLFRDYRTITKADMQRLGIGNPMDVVHKLRKRGYVIHTHAGHDLLGASTCVYAVDWEETNNRRRATSTAQKQAEAHTGFLTEWATNPALLFADRDAYIAEREKGHSPEFAELLTRIKREVRTGQRRSIRP